MPFAAADFPALLALNNAHAEERSLLDARLPGVGKTVRHLVRRLVAA